MGRNTLVKDSLENQYLSAAHKQAFHGPTHWKTRQAWAIYYKMKDRIEDDERMHELCQPGGAAGFDFSRSD